MIIKNGLIHDAIHPDAYIADILIKDGKIVEISKNIDVSEGEDVIDATGKEIYPGFVEAHSHIGLAARFGEPSGYSDNNEKTDSVTPQMRAIDAFDPFDKAIGRARKAGVTSVCTGPGSANVIGGTFAVFKTVGTRADRMLLKDNVSMKCAFGENVKNSHGSKNAATRMGIAALIRDYLMRAKQYQEKKEQGTASYDAKLEALLPVIKGEMPLKAHAHQSMDIFTAIRIAKEFGVKLTLEHVTDGDIIVEELAKEGIPLAVGPTMANGSKVETKNRNWSTPGVLAKAGCKVCIITDSPVVCEEYLPMCAGFAVKAGMNPFEALRAITINAAEHIGVENRVGSLEVGKDADILITNGCPFEISTNVEMVIIDGEIVEQ